ncbi:glycosyltransferase family 8 protein [Mucilaginibacter myungsuensis]|uniref:Glycosyltransferase family 8 protein n=1 Tax=Mucilaginibacter myungsuensis TaxID=649104 RepID=A0A929L468_9SPHI|nr:glycosyltransferase [Mucilaginibacter myungsuensis]MBE9662911.1 glycosyltransferase family 8 protein [Mucilaginibacter myungsuensis]MDN3598531.1 glycosyltransferase [Mucilaginibacter myungsuensis]
MAINNNIILTMNCDNDYIILMAALLKSIEVHHKSGEHIEVYMAGPNITKESKKKMLASIDPKMFTIHWKTLKEMIPKGMALPYDRNLFPATVYMRLFMPYIMPADVKKVLYLDVDMICLEDISNIWNTDVTDYVTAAVVDCRVTTLDNDWGGVLNYQALGLDGKHPYVNSGLQIMNVEKYREAQMAERVIKAINDNQKFAQYAEQYAMNTILPSIKWLQLDKKWNYFSTEEYQGEQGIIHYISRKPIHTTYAGKEIFKEIFFRYLNQTAWADAKQISEMRRLFKKVGIVFSKVKRQLT